MARETPEEVTERQAQEEAANLSEVEREFEKYATDGLTEAQRKIVDAMDLITCVRGFQTYVPRDEETRKALKAIYDWRDEIKYTQFLTEGIPDVSMEQIETFHKFWPEKYYGTDKYGHVLTITKISDINISGLEKMDEEVMVKIIAQKLAAFTEYRKKLSKTSGVQRYKYSILLDLKGCGMSLLGGKTRTMLNKVTDVAKNYFPETVWKIYCVNTPMMFRAVFGIVKPLLHPITQAKINVFNSVASLAKELKSTGMADDQLPDWFEGQHPGKDTIDVVKEIMADKKMEIIKE